MIRRAPLRRWPPHETRRERDGERGMILINVLLIVVLATSVLTIMIAGQDSSVERSISLRSASQAMAVARGGELSAISALRRDLVSPTPGDSLGEPWANINDTDVAIDGGRFSFVVADAQARFNINSLARGDAASRATLTQLAQAADLPGDTVERIGALISITGPISDLNALGIVGLDETQLRRLAQFCTALPEPTDVNLNTASEPLVAELLGNPSAARALVGLRSRNQGIDGGSLRGLGIILPPGTGLTSNYFYARSQVRIGATSQQLTSLLFRQQAQTGPQVIAIRRWRGIPPLEAPRLGEVKPQT